MIKNKKGIETVVAWVLLFGFSITLGTLVFMWATKTSEKMSESTVKFVAAGIECDQVQLYAVFDTKWGCNPCGCINITNRGYLTIEEIMIRGVNKATQEPLTNQKIPIPLMPKEEFIGTTDSWDLPAQTNLEVELVPIINVDKDQVGCTERAIILEC